MTNEEKNIEETREIDNTPLTKTELINTLLDFREKNRNNDNSNIPTSKTDINIDNSYLEHRERNFQNTTYRKLNSNLKDFLLDVRATGSSEVPIPIQYAPYINESLTNYGLRKYCTVASNLSSNVYCIPRTETIPTAYTRAESGSATLSSASARQNLITMKQTIVSVSVTNELFKVDTYNWMGWLQNEAMRALAKKEDSQIVAGNSDPWVGIYNDTGVNSINIALSGSTTNAYSNIAFTDFCNAEAAIGAGARNYTDTMWLLDGADIATYRNLKDSNNMPLIDVTGPIPRFLNYGMIQVDTGILNNYSVTGANTKHMILGNMKECWIADQGVKVFVDPYTRFQSNNETVFHFYIDEVIGLARPGAFCVVKTKASY